MSTSFGQSALVLSGLAARALGWRPHEFWAATPGELAAALGLGGSGDASLDRATLTQIFGERLTEPDHD